MLTHHFLLCVKMFLKIFPEFPKLLNLKCWTNIIGPDFLISAVLPLYWALNTILRFVL